MCTEPLQNFRRKGLSNSDSIYVIFLGAEQKELHDTVAKDWSLSPPTCFPLTSTHLFVAPPRGAEALAPTLVIFLINSSVTDDLNMAKNSQENALESAFDALQGQEDLHGGEEDLANCLGSPCVHQ